MNEYQKARYKRRRDDAIASLGGRCAWCSSTQRLELDHIVSGDKDYDISKIFVGGSEAKVQAELSKCQVLCHDCHVQKTQQSGDNKYVEHGGGNSGKRNCPCAPCKAKKAEYMRNYKHRSALV